MNEVFFQRKDRFVKYPQTPAAVNYVASTWVSAFNTGALEFGGELSSFQISFTEGATTTPTAPVHRLLHIPKGETTGAVFYTDINGQEETKSGECIVNYPSLKVQPGDQVIVQVNCNADATGTAQATVDFVEFKEKR